jgi:hypothetical protein
MSDRTRWLQAIPAIPAAILMVMLVRIWALRLFYPYDLEWMEGGMLAHAWRIDHRLPVYAAPGPDWIPFIYPPGYASLLAAAGDVTSLDYPVGRLISLGGAFAAAAAAAYFVGRHGRSPWYGLLAGVVFLGCYPESGAFYDLCRIDGLFIGLVAWSIVFGFEDRRLAPEASGMLLAAAFLVKQNGALFGLPLLGMIVARDGWRLGARFLVCSAVPALAMTGYLQFVTSGRYLTYILGVAAAHPNVFTRVFPGTPWELGAALPFALLAGVGWLLLRAMRRERLGWAALLAAIATFGALLFMPRPDASVPIGLPAIRGIENIASPTGAIAMGTLLAGLLATLGGGVVGYVEGRPRSWRFWGGAGIAIAALVTSALMRGHHGGFLNVHMQLHWVVAVGLGLAAAAGLEAGLAGRLGGVLFVGAQLVWQIARINPDKLVPDATDREVSDQIVARLREAAGPVLVPHAPWLAVKAGHPPGFHLIALWDVTQHQRTPFPAVSKDVMTAMRAGHWATILDDGPKGSARNNGIPGASFGYGVRDAYAVVDKLPGGPRDAVPRTGWKARPRWVLTPKGRSAGDCPAFAPPVEVAAVRDPSVVEASGLVASRRQPGVFWTHNDSGDSARIFALAADGRLLATVDLAGATAVDVEDIAAGPGPDGRPALFVADIGDNDARRPSVTVWRLDEPDVTNGARPVTTLELRYPDGPHDAETLLVDARTEHLYVLTKRADGETGIYRASSAASAPQVLERVGTLRFGAGDLPGSPKLTGGDISPDGKAIVLRTYTHAFWFRRDADVESALAGRPCVVPVADEPQGEGIAFGPESEAIWTVSEGSPTHLYRTGRARGPD